MGFLTRILFQLPTPLVAHHAGRPSAQDLEADLNLQLSDRLNRVHLESPAVTAVTTRQTKSAPPKRSPFFLRGAGETYCDVITNLAAGEER